MKKDQNKKTISPKKTKGFFVIAALVLVVVTTAIYYDSLNNQFTNWDDEAYIVSNPDIRSLHGDSISYSVKKTFTSYVVGNYHPLTMLSLSMEYSLFKLDPKPYHVDNLLLHLFNTLLVFYFIWLLTKQKWTAFFTAMLFAIHPMHVESVAWVSERKDLLYSFFSLATLCCYLKFIQSPKNKWLFYSISLLLFILSVLSKAMAVSIPLIFLLIDYFSDRKMTMHVIFEKIPFLSISIVFGIIAIEAQKSLNAIYVQSYNIFERILISCYGILMYLWKAVFPVNLSCYYNYPIKQNGMYPAVFYIAPFIVIVLLWLTFNSRRKGKDIIFGVGLFLITVALVLQILPVGGAIIAERYTYIPYIGIFFIIARYMNNLLENKTTWLKAYRIPLMIIFTTVSVAYAYVAFQRTMVWKDSISLWTDAINKFDKYPLAYSLRGVAYYKEGQYENAVSDLSNYILLNKNKPSVFYDRGLCYLELKKSNEAIEDFNMAIKLKPNYADAYYNRGSVYNDIGNFEEAIQDYTKAIRLYPGYKKAFYNRAGAYYLTHRFRQALDDAEQAQKLGYNVGQDFINAIKTGLDQNHP